MQLKKVQQKNQIKDIEEGIGPIDTLVYNLGAQTGMKLLDQTSLKEFEWGWKMATQGLFRVAKEICPVMASRGEGSLLVTSATAAVRGNKLNTLMLLQWEAEECYANL